MEEEEDGDNVACVDWEKRKKACELGLTWAF